MKQDSVRSVISALKYSATLVQEQKTSKAGYCWKIRFGKNVKLGFFNMQIKKNYPFSNCGDIRKYKCKYEKIQTINAFLNSHFLESSCIHI